MSVLVLRRKLLDESRVMELHRPGPGQYSPRSGVGQLGHQLKEPAGRPPAAGQADFARARALVQFGEFGEKQFLSFTTVF